MKNSICESGLGLDELLRKAVREGYKQALKRDTELEKERQKKFADKATSIKEKEDVSSATVSASQDDVKDPQYDDIVAKLNTIRAGKSLKDESIESSFKEYIDSLTKVERRALYAFLRGIAQIISGEISGKQAINPEDHPMNIEMRAGDKEQKRHIKPNIIKKPASPENKKPVASKEDTTPQTPITPLKNK